MIFKQGMIISEYIKTLKMNNLLVTRLNTSLKRLKKLKTCFNVHRDSCDDYVKICSFIKTLSFHRLTFENA